MFTPRQQPLLLVAERLLSLRLSINTPIVSTTELPAGPARAAIAVHSEGGRTLFTVAIRSLRHGASVLYELEGEDLDGASGIAVALDAALSFGESMGFLFDDEVIEDRSAASLRNAVGLLREIVAPPAPDVEETAPAFDAGAADEDGEILLEEALELEPVEPLAGAAPAPARPVAPALTKFRATPPEGAPGSIPAEAPGASPAPGAGADSGSGVTAGAGPGRTARGGALLGRVKPIRLRAPKASPPVPPLLRLLAAF